MKRLRNFFLVALLANIFPVCCGLDPVLIPLLNESDTDSVELAPLASFDHNGGQIIIPTGEDNFSRDRRNTRIVHAINLMLVMGFIIFLIVVIIIFA